MPARRPSGSCGVPEHSGPLPAHPGSRGLCKYWAVLVGLDFLLMTSSTVTGRPLFLGSPGALGRGPGAEVVPCDPRKPPLRRFPSPLSLPLLSPGTNLPKFVLVEAMPAQSRLHLSVVLAVKWNKRMIALGVKNFMKSPEARTPSLLFFWKRPFGSSDV